MKNNQFKTEKLKCKLLQNKNDLINKKIELKYIFKPQCKFIYKENKTNEKSI